MYKFLNTPLIPESKVKYVTVDARASKKLVLALERLGIITIKAMSSKKIHPSVSGHPDMLMHHLEKDLIVVAPDVFDMAVLTYKPLGLKIIKGKSELKSNYPQDIAYNIARIDKFAFHNLKYSDRIIREYFEKNNIKEVHVNQGYAKCSTCIISNVAVITSDKGMAKAFDNYNIDVLLIEPGFVLLDKLDYGFIGGATGLISNDILAVTGSLRNHPEYCKILNFCENYDVKLLELTDERPIDIGSIVPLIY